MLPLRLCPICTLGRYLLSTTSFSTSAVSKWLRSRSSTLFLQFLIFAGMSSLEV